MNKKLTWRIAIIVVIAVIVLIARSPKNSAPAAAQPIKIGAVLSLSGDAASDGESIKDGLELARADLAKSGTVVDITYQDDKTDSKDTVSAIQALSTQGVQAIIGPTWSFLGNSGVPVADRLGLVTIMPANTTEFVSAKSDYAFFTAIKVNLLASTLADWLKANNKKKVAVVGAQGPWFETVNAAVEQAVKQAGATIVYSDSMVYGQETNMMPTIMAKVKNSGADLLFMEIDNEPGINIMLKRISQLGIGADVMSIATGVGKVLNESAFSGKNAFYVAAPKASSEFQEKYRAVYGKLPRAYADSAYDSLVLLVQAMQNKGDRELKTYLRESTNYKGYATTYKFDKNGDIVGGEWVITKLR